MNITNEDVFNAFDPLNKLAQIKFPVKVSYSIAKLTDKLTRQYRVIEKVRAGLVRTYGTQRDDGSIKVETGDPGWDKFSAEFDELMSQEFEIVLDIIKLPRGVDVEPSILVPLIKFVDVEQEE